MKKIVLLGLIISATPALAIDTTSTFGAELYKQSLLGCKVTVVNEGLADKFVSVDDLCQCVAHNFIASLTKKDAIAIQQGAEDAAVAKRVSKLSADVNEKCMKQFAKPGTIKK